MTSHCDLANLLDQASRAIEPKRDHGAYAYMLGEVAGHVRQVRDGTASLAQFVDYYRIGPAVLDAAHVRATLETIERLATGQPGRNLGQCADALIEIGAIVRAALANIAGGQ